LNVGSKLSEYLHRLATHRDDGGWPRPADDGEAPLRSELFSADQMEQHGRILAAAHALAESCAADQLLARLAANESALVDVCRLLTAAVAANRRVTAAAEWLLDNFYLIEEQISTAKRHLPKGYSRELPRLASGPSADCPRVYDIALETIAHGDGRVDTETLGRFVDGLPDRHRPQAWRALGDPDHVTARTHRESPSRRRAYRCRLGMSEIWPIPGRTE
jgi:cyclic beta-1,2-glucan synthetase